jgi:hypothetical protein
MAGMGRGLRLLVAAWAASIAGSSLAAAVPTTRPSIRIVSMAPLTVRGTHFAARERVRVTFRTSVDAPVVTVRATAAGTFTTATPVGLTYDRCSTPLFVSAAGASGDHVVLKVPLRLCPPG